MGEIFYYALTETQAEEDRWYQRRAESPEGMARLGLRTGNIDSLLFIVPPSGKFYLLVPSERKDRFGQKVGPALFGTTGIGDRPEAIDSFREDLYIHSKPFSGDPRAVVHASHEAAFKEVAQALGLRPVKSSEEKF